MGPAEVHGFGQQYNLRASLGRLADKPRGSREVR
jgi:hypothetical protein